MVFNKENITIKQEYENILRFYGYDVDTTPNMMSESKTDMEEMMSTMNETNSTSVETTMMSSTVSSTTVPPYTTTKEEDTTMKTEEEDDTTTSTMEEMPTSNQESEDTTTEPETTETSPSDTDETTEALLTETEPAETEAPITRKRSPKGLLGRGLRVKKDRHHFTLSLKSNLDINRRQGRSYDLFGGEPLEYDLRYGSPSRGAPIPSLPLPPPTPIHQIRPEIKSQSFTPNSPAFTPKYQNKNDKLIFDNLDSDTIDHIFYLNEYETVRVPFKIYDTVMKYTYDSSIHAHVLEIELDTEHYDLIIVMPDYQYGGLNDVVKRLREQEPKKMRKIRQSLDYVWVKSIVPKFNLNGNTILTSDLQNVSINFSFTFFILHYLNVSDNWELQWNALIQNL